LTVTKDIFDTVELIGQYAAAAYCPGNYNNSTDLTKLVCPNSNNCQRVESAATSIVVRINQYV
jgi:hypothetical protein